jgi:hypothetical protein
VLLRLNGQCSFHVLDIHGVLVAQGSAFRGTDGTVSQT